MRISDWSSDVCSSDLHLRRAQPGVVGDRRHHLVGPTRRLVAGDRFDDLGHRGGVGQGPDRGPLDASSLALRAATWDRWPGLDIEHPELHGPPTSRPRHPPKPPRPDGTRTLLISTPRAPPLNRGKRWEENTSDRPTQM